MNISIHQNSLLPYLGFWNKAISSDRFYVLDEFQFSTSEMYHRTFIPDPKNPTELKYFTIKTGQIKDKKIREVTVDKKTTLDFLKSFQNNLIWYKKNVNCYHWKNVYDLFENVFALTKSIEQHAPETDRFSLSLLISLLNSPIYNYLDINNIYENNECGFTLHKTDLLLDIMKYDIPKTYYSGSGGRNYLDLDKFKEKGVDVYFQTPVKEFFKGWIIDYLFKYPKEEVISIIKETFIWTKA